MDEREEMTLFYLNRGLSGSGNQSNPSISHGHSTMRLPFSMGSSFKAEYNSSPNFHHDINAGGGGGIDGGGVVSITPPGSGNDSIVKKKRGRPRKYTPDESRMELGITPAPLSSPTEKKNKGRPPGSGWKQRLANVGEWMNTSAGLAFTPFIINVSIGEDVAEKISIFAQQKPRALCILSGSGTVSAITLRQFTSSVTYEGRFEILCLSGSYLLGENGGRTGGLSVSVCTGDGNVIGGAIGGRLVASSLVQVVVCSFIYGGNNVRVKTKTELTSTDEKSSGIQLNDTSPTHSQHFVEKPVAVPWQLESRGGVGDSRSEIDLTHG